MHNTKTPSSPGEHRSPTSGLVHQLDTTTTHVLSPRQAELLTTLGKIGGRDGDGEEQRKGREEGRFLDGNMGEGHKGQQRNDGRRSKLQQEQRQLTALPSRGATSEHWGGTSPTHGHIQSVQLKEEVKGEKMGGLRYCSRIHKVAKIRREAGRGGRQL